MKAKGKRSVLIFIPKWKFHFISVFKFSWTSMYPFPVDIFSCCLGEKLFHLGFFHFQLFLIGHSLVHAAATLGKNRTYRISCFQWGLFQYLKQSSFSSSGTLLIDHKAVFYNYLFTINIHDPFIGKINFFNNSLIYFTFFHNNLPLTMSLRSHRYITKESPVADGVFM